MTGEAGLSLYGNAAGDWAFVESAPGLIPAPCFGDLRYLGHPDDAITSIYGMIPGHGKTGRGARYPAQQMLAGLAGVSQQSVSRYLREKSRPELTHEGWRRVCALLYAWTEWPDKPCDEQAVRAFLRGGDAIREAKRQDDGSTSAPGNGAEG